MSFTSQVQGQAIEMGTLVVKDVNTNVRSSGPGWILLLQEELMVELSTSSAVLLLAAMCVQI